MLLVTTPIALQIASLLSVLDVTPIKICETDIGSDTGIAAVSLVLCNPHCSVQWGSLLGVKTLQTITYQISFTNFARAIGVSSDLTIIAAIQNESVLKFDAVFPSQSQITSFRWVAIGK